MNKIITENLGVLAYEYQFGNGDSMVNGQYGLLYEVIVDARTGVPLRIQSPSALGAASGGKSKVWNVPTGKVDAWIRDGNKSSHMKGTRFVKLGAVPSGKSVSSTLQIAKSYWSVQRIGKNQLNIGGVWYILK